MGTTALLLHEQVFCPLMEASGLQAFMLLCRLGFHWNDFPTAGISLTDAVVLNIVCWSGL